MIEVAVLVIIALTLIYEFGNGINDAANAIATIVATRVVSRRGAILIAALGNFVGPFLFGVAVATTIGKGIVDPAVIDYNMLMAALIGASFWTYAVTWKGIPISITHALVGGFMGTGIMGAGMGAIISSKLMIIFTFIAMAPLIGAVVAFGFTIFVMRLTMKLVASKANFLFRKLQLVSATLYSMAHGANDAQNGMGMIAITLFTAGMLTGEFFVPWWVILLSASAISIGTAAGGWRVVKTMGMRITKLRPVDGFCAETSGGFTLFLCTMLGIPVSTTHVICGSIMGTGSVKRLSAVRWAVARKVLKAWVVTIPASAAVGAGVYALLSML